MNAQAPVAASAAQDAPVVSEGGSAAVSLPPAPVSPTTETCTLPRVALQNVHGLRARRQAVAAALEGARRALQAAEARRDSVILAVAHGGAPPGSASGVAQSEIDEAAAAVRNQEYALKLVDRELAAYTEPERVRACEAQKAEWLRLRERRLKMFDALEAVFRDDVAPLLKKIERNKAALASALVGHAVQPGQAEEKRRFARMLHRYLRPYVDPREFAFFTDYAPAEAPWSEQEAAFIDPRELEDLA